MDPALRELLRAANGQENRMVEAIIRLRESGLTVPGVQFVARFGPIATCRLRMGSILEVHSHPDVVSLKAARSIGPEPLEMESAKDEGGAVAEALQPRELGGLTGRGVVVGVIDWGLDFDHPCFKNADGTTRLLALWDQRTAPVGKGPRPFGYGTLHLADEINDALGSPTPYAALGYHPADADRGGGSHGTHVMGILAGGNSYGGSPSGIAPDSALVFVELAHHDLGGLSNLGDSVRLMEAVAFIAQIAGDRPWVINLSVGKMSGPHDGSTLCELGFDYLLRAAPGRFICQSAGNYYKTKTHASGVLKQGETRTLTLVTEEGDSSINEVEIWYDGQDDLAVRVAPPGGVLTRAIPPGDEADVLFGKQVAGRIYNRISDPNNGNNHVDAFLLPQGHSGAWTVTLKARQVRGGGAFHAWIERDQACSTCQTRFVPQDSDSTCTLGTLASSHVPVVVGAYDEFSPIHAVASFSSSGPTSDGRPRPDVCAPGVGVLAARSAPRGSTSSPGHYVRKSGTSMATPQVTGAVALCLQIGGHRLDAQQIRKLVLESASPQETKAEDSQRVGAGHLNIPDLVAATQRNFSTPSQFGSRKDGTVNDPTEALPLAPARVYRELMYRPRSPESHELERKFDVVARPGDRVPATLKSGDIVIRATLGNPGVGECSLVTDRCLSRQHVSSHKSPQSWNATGTDLVLGESSIKIAGSSGQVRLGVMVLRPRSRQSARVAEDESAESDTRSLAAVDSAAAVPTFDETERKRVVEPLLSADVGAAAAAWNRRMHPSVSGITMDQIRDALAGYVDFAAVAKTLATRMKDRAAEGSSTSATEKEKLLSECLHQFQKKCYAEKQMHDGRAGESTLDSLGFIAQEGPGLGSADRGNSKAQQRLTKLDAKIRAAAKNLTAANWFDRMANPAIFGYTTNHGRGLHVVLIRKLRQAERYLLTLPALRGKTPVEIGKILGLGERHRGARPQAQSTSMHTFGLAIDIEYAGSPWVRSSVSWAALQRAARLVSGEFLTQESAPGYFSSLGSDPSRSTGQIWDELRKRHTELVTYLEFADDSGALGAALQAAQERGTSQIAHKTETPEETAVRWRSQILKDRQALDGGDFRGHYPATKGFLNLHRDLVIALRDYGCLAWGAVDLGPGKRGSGDMMHFDARIDRVGRLLIEGTHAFEPRRGHPCLAASKSPVKDTENGDH